MCHLILFMPVFALPVFWLLPMAAALTVYAVVTGLSLWLYYFAWRAMRVRSICGREGLLGARGVVTNTAVRPIRVRVKSEDWGAESSETLRPGDRVEVVAVQGLRLRVRSVA